MLVLEGELWRLGLAEAHHRDGSTGSSSLGRSLLSYDLLEVTSNLNIEPVEKEMETHSSIPSWKMPGQRNLAGYR